MLGKARSRARVAAAMAFAAGLAGAFSLAPASRADELKLKDGTKITGVIVGFEENSFKVKTSFGYALVQKDQVVSISISDSGPKAAVSAPATKDAKTETPSLPKPAATSAPPPAEKKSAAPTAQATAAKPSAPPPASSVAQPARPTTAFATPPSSAPAQSAAPEPIREEVNGNTYANDTYGFRMYKPPDWDVIQGARSVLPGAITAMGTEDQSTYLLIGQNPVGKSLAADMDATNDRLRDTLDNFRTTSEAKVIVAGIPAVERKFRGSVDNHDWSGVVVFVPRGPRLFTIFGMTLADNDLVQIQENVISRAIDSIQFTR